MRKYFIGVWILLGLAAFFVSAIQAQETTPVSIEVFEQLTCTHCQAEKAFLQDLQKERDDIRVTFYDIALQENYDLFQQVTDIEGLPKVTPLTLVGSTIVQGFGSAETTGQQILAIVERSAGQKSYTFSELIEIGGLGSVTIGGDTCEDGSPCRIDPSDLPYFVNLPFYGPVDVGQYTLPILSIVLGFIDGFNPCAMWVLVTFLIILAQVGSRKKMLQVAGLFIIAEAVMYYLILNVWFTAWDFVGLDDVVTPIVGLVAIGGGLFFLYEWRTNKGTCNIITGQKQLKTRQRIRDIVAKPMTVVGAIGVIGIAFSVNVIEFACSIGIPQAFTKIIELNNVGFWTTQWYMALYILFYMIDDLIVFGIALYSFDKIGLASKYSRWSSLIGGVLMIALGILLIFARELLVF